MSEKKELSDEQLSKATGGDDIKVETNWGRPQCPYCPETYLEKVFDGGIVETLSSGKKVQTNEFEDSCGDRYLLYECPSCHKKFREYFDSDGFPEWETHED